jgi:hypothetical protein
LVPDAVRLVTKIEQDFSKEAQTHLVVLIELFRGVLKNCRSGDAISLAIYAAEDKLQGAVDPVIIRASALWWLRMLDRPQPTDPMYETFDEARHAP